MPSVPWSDSEALIFRDPPAATGTVSPEAGVGGGEGVPGRPTSGVVVEAEADAVSEATVQGTRLTIDLDGATYVFRQYMPDD